jgi:glycosyltransferase 2 family protein
MYKKWLSLSVKFLVSGALIWFLLDDIDISTMKDVLMAAAPEMLILTVGIFLIQAGICAMRWRAVLDAINAPLPFGTALRFFFIGAFFNQTLPSSVGGDAVRIYVSYRSGLTLGNAFSGVMIERVATVLALVIVVLAMQPVFLPRVDAEMATIIVPVVAFLAVGAAAGLAVLLFLNRLPDSWGRWRLARAMVLLGGDARRVFLVPEAAAKTMFWAIIGHANVTLGVYWLALGLGLDVTWTDCMALFPLVLLVTTLPISIAGWGVREYAMAGAFGLIGVAKEGAVSLSLLFGLLTLVVSLIGGLIWIMEGRKRDDAAVEKTVEAAVSGGDG